MALIRLEWHEDPAPPQHEMRQKSVLDSSPDYSRSLTSLMNKGNVVLRGWSQCAGC
jgi:hypothetical protein